MRIIGWIRLGDKAACGGKVVEGVENCKSLGVPYSFEGARMACSNNCVIAEGYSHHILPNRRSKVLHGMKTSGGCPLYSTLNDKDGVSNQRGDAIPLSFVQDHNGKWVGDTSAEQTGKRFLVKNSETGEALANRKFIAVVGGAKQEGMTDKNGYAHVDAKDGDSVELHLVFEAPTGPLKHGGVQHGH